MWRRCFLATSNPCTFRLSSPCSAATLSSCVRGRFQSHALRKGCTGSFTRAFERRKREVFRSHRKPHRADRRTPADGERRCSGNSAYPESANQSLLGYHERPEL